MTLTPTATSRDPDVSPDPDISPDTHATGHAPDPNPAAERAAFQAGRAAAGNRGLLMVLGGFVVLGGVVAIALPFIASLAAALTTGWVLLATGLLGLAAAFRRHKGWHLAAAFAASLLTLVAGVLFILQPLAGIVALTTLVIAYFAAAGALRMYYGARSLQEGGGWMTALGALSFALAVVLWLGLPLSATWVPGLLLGIDLILWGALLITMAIQAGRPPERLDG